MKNLSRYIKNIKYQHSTKIANWLVELSTYKAKRILKESEPIGVLVDNTVLSHATTHKTTWIHTGLKTIMLKLDIWLELQSIHQRLKLVNMMTLAISPACFLSNEQDF
ncbi:hypothetical protein CO695_10525 [Providencia alcalifaciens]|uniref:Uncharacterized protein n=1 Tax=Providencia alcalifaciens DSM 30120 TaxID=520999 RepID=B6XCT7_9GAMM|nr:hypothetical protein CO695_10525 [Providencia alcalifaciens]EEB46835.1 hypothetical protein PROVALCAL_01153 [Providencia alcalifaciens DSM 30120]SQI39416.1 Uncharacterised protein [Providencia alcalifaciens]